jgi:tetratricopeptide (TPR) repeat protein
MKLLKPLIFILLSNISAWAQIPDSLLSYYQQLPDYSVAAKLATIYDDLRELDSIEKYAKMVLDDKKSKNTIEEIEAHNHLTKYYILTGDYNLAKLQNQLSIQSSEKQSDPTYLARAYLYEGLVFYYLGEISNAETAYRRSLQIYLDAGDNADAAALYLNLGILDRSKGDYGKAVENYQQALSIYESERDTANIGRVLNNIGNVYLYLEQDYKQALTYHERALQMFIARKDSLRMATLQNNIGTAYIELGEFDKAKNNFNASLSIFELYNNVQGIASTYDALGSVYFETNEPKRALEYYLQAKDLFEALDDARNVILQEYNLGNTYLQLQNYSEARKHFDNSLRGAEDRQLKEVIMKVNLGLSGVYENTGNMAKSLEHYKLYSLYRDSTLSENTQQIVQDLNTKYETEKTQQELVHQQTENELLTLQNKRSRGIMFGVIGVLVIILGFSALLYRQFREKKRANFKLQISNKQIREQHDQIKHQSEEIKSSITYASFIQSAIMPPDELFKESFDDYFVLFKPRDVVSGDFYWLHKQDEKVVFVCADCTGHGVPGAFMSMLGMSAFTHVVGNEAKQLTTDAILNEVRNIIIAQLHQTGRLAEAKDGMDLSMCIIDQKEMKMQISGAYNPVYFITRRRRSTNI